MEMARKFSRSNSLWMGFKKIWLEIVHWARQSSDNKGEANFDADKGLPYCTECKLQMKKVLKALQAQTQSIMLAAHLAYVCHANGPL